MARVTSHTLDSKIKSLADEAEGVEVSGYWRVVIDDIQALDPSYFRTQPDMQLIRKHLEHGTKVAGVHLEWCYSIRTQETPIAYEEFRDGSRRAVTDEKLAVEVKA